ncbi:hypothetical protein PVAND_009844 [Polypedilum vanderplanki]|uniref:protein-glutamine gamma-glutamyltransferase n=1 Tax=Polypedilum vanderplanki TaxID=319348 RepID=A0A9J6CEH4_POLVA|nr:hypothetical protein PVAND_009844 [Polypedilum vanderplanki]
MLIYAFYSTDSVSHDILAIEKVDLCAARNGKTHHTDRFDLMKREIPKLVVRRGQVFKLQLHCNRPYNMERDQISLIFSVADVEKPSFGHGTLIAVSLKNRSTDLGKSFEWGAAVNSINGNLLEIVIKTAANALVTNWKMDIDTKIVDNNLSRSYSLPQPFYLLFNPWCREDEVYMEDERERNEYVLSDTTLIWKGTYNRLRPSPWKLGQYERDVLDCALYVVAFIGKVNPSSRGNPVRVARALSAAVNSPDDEGLLLGNWTNDFSGGTAPTKWGGSVEIMQRFYRKRRPVKFAQCWVFAGCLTTIARCLGIPSRIITNYSSAHDTQASMTVDYFVDDDGKVMEEMGADSIWNYHVWNEVWMSRPDLNSQEDNYDGWQAVDATPQETSNDGMYKCGPASVIAVKRGEVLKPYDNVFLYSEVNADKVFWRYAGSGNPLKLIKKDEFGIGHFISTKAVGKWERQDITKSYKYDEKTDEERATMLKALKQANSAFSRYYLNEEFNEVHFNFELKDDIKIGEDFSVVIHIKNKSSEKKHTVNGNLLVESVLYTGKSRKDIKSMKFSEVVEPLTDKSVVLEVTFDEYYKKLLDQSAFNIACMASVENTDYEYFAQDDFRVRKPDIKIVFTGKPTHDVAHDIHIRLENPLPIPMTKGVFHIEGSGIEEPLILKIADVQPKHFAETRFAYKPKYVGSAKLVAKFTCKEVDDIDGFRVFEIAPKPDDMLMNENNHDKIISKVANEE